jgi:hypothetical protein
LAATGFEYDKVYDAANAELYIVLTKYSNEEKAKLIAEAKSSGKYQESDWQNE